MEVCWYYQNKIRHKLNELNVDYHIGDIFADWIPTEENEVEFVFYSLDDFVTTMKKLFPIATYSLDKNSSMDIFYVSNFDPHLYEYKEYRKNCKITLLR